MSYDMNDKLISNSHNHCPPQNSWALNKIKATYQTNKNIKRTTKKKNGEKNAQKVEAHTRNKEKRIKSSENQPSELRATKRINEKKKEKTCINDCGSALPHCFGLCGELS